MAASLSWISLSPFSGNAGGHPPDSSSYFVGNNSAEFKGAIRVNHGRLHSHRTVPSAVRMIGPPADESDMSIYSEPIRLHADSGFRSIERWHRGYGVDVPPSYVRE